MPSQRNTKDQTPDAAEITGANTGSAAPERGDPNAGATPAKVDPGDAPRADAPPERLPNTEYSSVAAATRQQRRAGRGVGDFADKTYYIDADGKVSTEPPVRSKVLVAQGDTITPTIAEKLGGGK